MQTMTEAGTEKRVEELSKRVDDGFAKVDRRFEKVDEDFREVRGEIRDLRADVNRGFAAIDKKFDAKFDSLNRTIVVMLGGSLSVVTGGLIAAVFHVVS